MADIIKMQLSLVIHLIDTTTGYSILESNVSFYRDGAKLSTLSRGNGLFLVMNESKENFKLKSVIYGYEENVTEIDFATLEQKLPMQEIYLIPKTLRGVNEGLLTLQGVYMGINSIKAVPLYSHHLYTRGYEEQKRIISVFNPHKKNLLNHHYAIIAKDNSSFEEFVLLEQPDAKRIKIQNSIKSDCNNDCAIERVIFGITDSEGNYLLRVRDDSPKIPYLIRYEVEGEENFELMDFRQIHELGSGRDGD